MSVAQIGPEQTNRRIYFIDRSITVDADIVFVYPLAAEETGSPSIAFSGIYFHAAVLIMFIPHNGLLFPASFPLQDLQFWSREEPVGIADTQISYQPVAGRGIQDPADFCRI